MGSKFLYSPVPNKPPVNGRIPEMISPQCHDACLTRLGLLKYFPAVRAEVGKFLYSLCSGDNEARDLVAAICREHDEWPGPATVQRLHASIRSQSASDGLPFGCDICKGDYWVSSLEEANFQGKPYEHYVARRCTCTRGQALREMGRQHSQRGRRQ
jgi:hypothetical protein